MVDTGLTSINGNEFENGLYMEEQGEERALYSWVELLLRHSC